MSIGEKIRNAQTTASLIFVTILIVPFQFLLIFGLVASASANPETFNTNSILLNLAFIIGYILLPIIYAIITSFLFSPKRIVSPINIQIATGLALSIISFVGNVLTFHPTGTQLLSFISNLIFASTFLIFGLVILGFLQLMVVKYFVGVNNMGMDRKSFVINCNVNTIDNILQRFVTLRGYVREVASDNEIMYRKPRAASEQVILTLGANPKDKQSSILATIAFRKGMYDISVSKRASDIRDSLIMEITGRLVTNQTPYKITELKSLEDPVSAWVHAEAYAPTISKIPRMEQVEALWERIPTYFRIIMGITIITIIGITVLYWTQYVTISSDTFIPTIIGLIVALCIEMGIPLREELKVKSTK